MAATIAGSLKTLIEGLGLGVTVYRDVAGRDAVFPYVTVREQISLVPEPAFNANDDPDHHARELVQVDLWQQWRNDDGSKAEDVVLAERVIAALDGARLPDAPNAVDGVQLIGAPRLLEEENNVVHHPVTLAVRRVLVRS